MEDKNLLLNSAVLRIKELIEGEILFLEKEITNKLNFIENILKYMPKYVGYLTQNIERSINEFYKSLEDYKYSLPYLNEYNEIIEKKIYEEISKNIDIDLEYLDELINILKSLREEINEKLNKVNSALKDLTEIIIQSPEYNNILKTLSDLKSLSFDKLAQIDNLITKINQYKSALSNLKGITK